MNNTEKYYLSRVDVNKKSIYCHHDKFGELLIPKHMHEKSQFIYTEGGIVYIKIEQKTFYLPARHFMWIPKGIIHSIYTSSENAVMRNLYFPSDENEHSFYQKTATYPLNDLLFESLILSSRWNGDILPGERSFDILKGIKAILPEIYDDKNAFSLSLPISKNDNFQVILNFIKDNVDKKIKYPDIAKKFALGERTLNRLFRSEIGMSYIQFMGICKILKAIELITEKKYNLNEISEKAGYESPQTFSNTFLKITGKRPKDYLL